MTTYNITNDIYEEMVERCSGTFPWDCIELSDGYAVVFACKNNKPYDVETRDEEDNIVANDFSIVKFNAFAA